MENLILSSLWRGREGRGEGRTSRRTPVLPVSAVFVDSRRFSFREKRHPLLRYSAASFPSLPVARRRSTGGNNGNTRRIESIHSSQASNKRSCVMPARQGVCSSIFSLLSVTPSLYFLLSISRLFMPLLPPLFLFYSSSTFFFFFLSLFFPRPVLPGFVLCSLPPSQPAVRRVPGDSLKTAPFHGGFDNASRERRKAHAGCVISSAWKIRVFQRGAGNFLAARTAIEMIWNERYHGVSAFRERPWDIEELDRGWEG